MTTLVKLTEPGSFHTLTVTAVSVNDEGKWPDYNLTDGTNTVVIPKSAADRQLERLKLGGVYDLVGSSVKVSRSEKPGANGKHFWNLEIVNAREANPTPTKRIPPPSGAPPQGVSRGSLPFDDDPGPQDPDGPYANSPTIEDVERIQQPPRNARETRVQGSGVSERETAYLACFDRVVAHVTRIAKAHSLPVDASACQAITFSIFGGQR